MESLLPEIAVKVAQHLTPRDLTACCGVSVHWRQAFGTDWVWKPHCDQDLEEYLRTTPCLVEPAFSVPGEQDSRLAPLCRWRTAFLREQRLWTNWHSRKFIGIDHDVKGLIRPGLSFVSNDFVLGFYDSSVKLWKVRVNPPVCVDTLNIAYEKIVLSQNSLLILKSDNFIPVVKVDTTEGTLGVKYWISFNEINKIPEIICDIGEPSGRVAPFRDNFEVIMTAGTPTKCFGYFNSDSSFHVWDSENGLNLKKEPLPSDSLGCGLTIVGPYRGSKCRDVLVLSYNPDELQGTLCNLLVHCRVYSGKEFKFLSFEQMFKNDTDSVYRKTTYCAIIDNFVALPDCREAMNIFNYQTEQKLFTLLVRDYPSGSISTSRRVLGIGDSCFLFCRDYPSERRDPAFASRLCLYNCRSGATIEDFTNSDEFNVVGNQLVLTTSRIDIFWRITNLSTLKPFNPPSLATLGIYKRSTKIDINQACTRLVRYNRSIIRIEHYW